MTYADGFNLCFGKTARTLRARRFGNAALGCLALGCWALATWEVLGNTGIAAKLQAAGYLMIAGGVGLGLLQAWSKRLTDPEVALLLDAQLQSHELLTTTLEASHDSPLREALRRRALQLLQGHKLRAALPAWTTNRTGWLIAGLGATLWFQANPVRPPLGQVLSVPATTLGPAQVAPVERLTELVDVTQDAVHQARLKRIADAAQRALKAGVPGAPNPAGASELRGVVAAELRELRADLSAPSSVLELFRDSHLSDARAALERADPGAFDRALRQLARSDQAAVREHARASLERARTLPATRRVLATLLEQELRRFINEEARHAQQTVAPKPEQRDDVPSTPNPSANLARPGNTASLHEPAVAPHRPASSDGAKRFGPGREPSERAEWLGASEHGQAVDAEAERARERSSPDVDIRPFDPANVVDQHEALAAAARSLDPRPRDKLQTAQDATPPQSGLPGDGPAGKRAQQPSAGQFGASGEHTAMRERGSDTPRPTLALDGTPPLQFGRPLLQARPGRGQAPKSEEPARPRTNSASPARPELLEGVEHADIPSEYREQVRRYFAP